MVGMAVIKVVVNIVEAVLVVGNVVAITEVTQWWIQDFFKGGSGVVPRAKILEATPIWGSKHAHLRSF